MSHPLRDLLARAGRPVLVLHDELTAGLAGDLVEGLDGDIRLHPVGRPIPETPRRWPAAALIAADGSSLRRSVSVLPPLGRSRLLAWLLVDADEPALVLPRPDWPAIGTVHGRLLTEGGAMTTVRSDGPVPVRDVLAQVARALGPAVSGAGGAVVATTDPDPRHAPPADAGLRVVATPAVAADVDDRWPPDVVLARAAPAEPMPAHPITGRSPTVVSGRDLLDGPIDEGLVNPAGFIRHATRGEATLELGPGGLLRFTGARIDRSLDHDVTPAIVAELRPYAALRIAWPASPSPELLRAVAALATAGVPLVGGAPPAGSPGSLGDELSALLALDRDLGTALAREEHSIELRRAALRHHSTLAWRGRLAEAAGLRWRRFPSCSLLLPLPAGTDPPQVLGRLSPQRGADVEIVIASEGPGPDVEDLAVRAGHQATAVTTTARASLGALLADAADAASGDVLVALSPGDWFGPDTAADLLWAQHYSGAELVGLPAELSYDPAADRTVRRPVATERFTIPPTGSSVMVRRSDLRALGGWPPGSAGATALANDVRARGAAVYTTHGLNHLAGQGRYGPDGTRPDEQWKGLRPSRLHGPPETGRDSKEPTA